MSDQPITIVQQTPTAGLANLQVLGDRARDYARASKAPSTRRAYAADWQAFSSWCAELGLEPLPAEASTLIGYLTAHAGQLHTSTLQRRLSAIAQAHKTANFVSPTTHQQVRLVWAGIRRTHGTAQVGKAPALIEDLRAMVEAMAPRRRGQAWKLEDLRDRALLLVGFAGAFRRSELVSLDVADVEFSRAGLVITLRRSKTDQEGQGRKIGIPRGAAATTCPVAALQAYLQASGIESGPLFRGMTKAGQLRGWRLSDRAVALIVKRHAAQIGLDPERFAGHSLRAGLATSAAAAGASERAIAKQTGHKSMTVLRRYIRDGELFRDNAAAAAGL